jgi:hypothetical protein
LPLVAHTETKSKRLGREGERESTWSQGNVVVDAGLPAPVLVLLLVVCAVMHRKLAKERASAGGGRERRRIPTRNDEMRMRLGTSLMDTCLKISSPKIVNGSFENLA